MINAIRAIIFSKEICKKEFFLINLFVGCGIPHKILFLKLRLIDSSLKKYEILIFSSKELKKLYSFF